MLLLALDTSTPCVAVAVCRHGVVLGQSCVVDGRRHGELLAVGIREALSAANLTPRQLEGIAVGVGPGPYTGLRIGLVTARSLGHALGIPVHGVCSLDILASAVAQEISGEYLVATDARRKEVYWARYREGVRLAGPGVGRPVDVAERGPVIGEGGILYPGAFPNSRGPIHPAPGDLALLVEGLLVRGEATLAPIPLYLRRPDAVEPGAAKKVSAAAALP